MTQLTINSVQHDFKIWRTSRSKKGKIPDYLWDKTLKLLDHYPIGKVVMALGLSGSQVLAKRKKCEINSTAVPLASSVNFVELNIPLATPYDTPTPNSFSRLEIKRSDGTVLAIERPTEQTLLQALNQFTGGVQ